MFHNYRASVIKVRVSNYFLKYSVIKRIIIVEHYGVPTISRLRKIVGLFCKRALWKKLYSAKETYNLKKPTNRSHPIVTEMW